MEEFCLMDSIFSFILIFLRLLFERSLYNTMLFSIAAATFSTSGT